MSTATVTPGYVFANNELVTYTKLNALGNPSVAVTGATSGSATIQNYLRNGNFYASTWLTPSGVNCPAATETFNAQFWSVNPQGANVSYAQNTGVPNLHSLYSAAIVGNTSATTVTLSQTILGDLSDTLNNNVSFSCWIFNNSGTNLTPTLIISSANVYNNFSAVTQIASQNLSTIASGLWAFENSTVNLTGLSNVNNGIKVSISFPSGSLASNTQSVLVSQVTLVPGTSYITYIDDFGLFSPLGYQPLYNPVNNVVLNCNCEIDQQVAAPYSGITGTSTIKTFDSWTVQTHGTLSVTHSKDTSPALNPINQYNPFISTAGEITVQTAEASLGASDLLLVVNKIEGYLMEPLIGRPLSLQFWVRASQTGTFYVSLSNSNGGTMYIAPYTVISAGTWQQILIQNIPSMPTGTGTWNFANGLGLQITWALGFGSTYQTTSGNISTWTTVGAYGTSSQVNVASSTSNTWEVAGVQLEAGAVCTPLNVLALPDQLQKLWRYYWKSTAYATAPNTNTAVGAIVGTAINSTSSYINVRNPVKMRLNPPSAFAYWGGVNANARDLTTSATITGVTPVNVSDDGYTEISYSSEGSAGDLVMIQAILDARL
jgi:hypothetical protein